MISISIIKRTPCPVSSKELKECVLRVFTENGIASDAEASVVLVSRNQMKEYVEKHLGEKGEEALSHPVLSFVQSEMEGPFVFPPDEQLHLGEIIVSYPHALEEAKKSNITILKAVCDLAEHGALHLLGIHHD